MSIVFHDGSASIYKRYCNSKKWNDASLLQLNAEASKYDAWLIEQNTEENLKSLLETAAVTELVPYKGGYKLGTLIELDNESMIIVKGLHQWKRVAGTWNYKLHITLGLDGRLWHLDALYTDSSATVSFLGDLTAGESLSDETHDGWSIQKK